MGSEENERAEGKRGELDVQMEEKWKGIQRRGTGVAVKGRMTEDERTCCG